MATPTAEPSSSLAGQWCGLDLGSATLWLLSVTDQSDQLLAFGLQFDANLIGRATGAGTLSGQFQLFGQAAVGSEDDGPGGPPGEDPTGEGPDDGPGDNPEDIPGHDPPDQDPPGQVPPGQIPPGQGSSDQGGQNPTNQPSQVGRAGSANQSANGQTGGPDVRRFRSNRITTP